MGKTHFPLIGNLYLIGAIGDHSRFLLWGLWFYRKFGINAYQVMYNAFIRFGLPEAILSDRGPQFKPTSRAREANYQWYASKLGITLLYGRKPQAKGKIEGLFRFIQRDFVMENMHLTTIKTESLRRLTREELEFILVHEEPRRVLKTGAITYYGHYYQVPNEYIKRRVWTKLKGDKLIIECGGEIIAQYALRQERYADLPARKT